MDINNQAFRMRPNEVRVVSGAQNIVDFLGDAVVGEALWDEHKIRFMGKFNGQSVIREINPSTQVLIFSMDLGHLVVDKDAVDLVLFPARTEDMSSKVGDIMVEALRKVSSQEEAVLLEGIAREMKTLLGLYDMLSQRDSGIEGLVKANSVLRNAAVVQQQYLNACDKFDAELLELHHQVPMDTDAVEEVACVCADCDQPWPCRTFEVHGRVVAEFRKVREELDRESGN